MSTTRSHSLPAPATDARRAAALILVAHGERGGCGRDESLRAHVRRLERLFPGLQIRAFALNGDLTMEAAFAGIPQEGPVHVFPMFMSEGYFTKQAIPAALSRLGHLNQDRIRLHPPLGVIDGLAALVETHARDGALQLAVDCHATTVVLAGHGSANGSASRAAIERQRALLDEKGIFASVQAAYLEEPPLLDSLLEGIDGPLVVVGMFAGEGLHAAEDVPRSLARLRRPSAVYTGTIGADPAIPALIAASIMSPPVPL